MNHQCDNMHDIDGYRANFEGPCQCMMGNEELGSIINLVNLV